MLKYIIRKLEINKYSIILGILILVGYIIYKIIKKH